MRPTACTARPPPARGEPHAPAVRNTTRVYTTQPHGVLSQPSTQRNLLLKTQPYKRPHVNNCTHSVNNKRRSPVAVLLPPALRLEGWGSRCAPTPPGRHGVPAWKERAVLVSGSLEVSPRCSETGATLVSYHTHCVCAAFGGTRPAAFGCQQPEGLPTHCAQCTQTANTRNERQQQHAVLHDSEAGIRGTGERRERRPKADTGSTATAVPRLPRT
jgi:hypothetical protein